jgi:hypothetical protein
MGKILHKCQWERERKREREFLLQDFSKIKIFVTFKDVLKGFCHFVIQFSVWSSFFTTF